VTDAVDDSKLQAKLIRLQGVVAGLSGKVIAKLALGLEREMKIEAPIDTGRLRNSIEAKVETDRATVGTSVRYAKYVAFGSPAHLIRPRDKKALSWPGGPGPRRIVHHPGNKPNPFHLRAAAKLKGDAEAIARAVIVQETQTFR